MSPVHLAFLLGTGAPAPTFGRPSPSPEEDFPKVCFLRKDGRPSSKTHHDHAGCCCAGSCPCAGGRVPALGACPCAAGRDPPTLLDSPFLAWAQGTGRSLGTRPSPTANPKFRAAPALGCWVSTTPTSTNSRSCG